MGENKKRKGKIKGKDRKGGRGGKKESSRNFQLLSAKAATAFSTS